MFTEYKIKWVKRHILIDDEQGLLIDTGSPASFHASGSISLCGEKIEVPSKLIGVTESYLQKVLSEEVHGLIGMDILSLHPILFNLHDGSDFVFLDDDACYHNALESFSLAGICQGLFIYWGDRKLKMVFDTGAPISYINSRYIENQHVIRTESDFSPLIGNSFTANMVSVPVSIEKGHVEDVEFGYSKQVDSILTQLNVDGIIGSSILRKYRIQMKNGIMFLPPQGI
jgi:hypothetical protein